jgi:hypothetical protein
VLLADLEAVADALGRDGDWLLAALTELVDTSVVKVAVEPEGSRYTLPDAMVELAVEWLAIAPEAAAVRRAVAVRYLDRVRNWSRDGGGPARTVIDRDADNVRAAISLAVQDDLINVAADRGGTSFVLRVHRAASRRSAHARRGGRQVSAGLDTRGAAGQIAQRPH